MQIWIDAKCIGGAMRHGRGNAKITVSDVAKILGMTGCDYSRIERGKKIMSENVMARMMTLAFLQMRTRQFTGARYLSPLKPENKDTVFISDK